jgi:hypothetical protein
MALTLRRRIGERTLVADEHGRWVFAPDELPASSPEELSRLAAPRSLASWPGPSTHVLILERGGATMSLDDAKAAVDFAYRSPAPGVSFELEPGGGGAAAWSAASFAMDYAERKAEWSKRAARFTVRLRGEPDDRQTELFARHSAEVRQILDASGRPFCPTTHRALLLVGKNAQDPAAWVKAVAAAGASSVLLEPAAPDAGFVRFYEKALDAMLGEESLVEERAAAFFQCRRWDLPGYDILNELAYLPGGGLASSERGLPLGDTRTTLYNELKDVDVVRACLAAALPDNQPRCQSCAYRAFCAVPPSHHWNSQATLWGRTPESPWCALHMGILDALFSRCSDDKSAFALRRFGAGNP